MNARTTRTLAAALSLTAALAISGCSGDDKPEMTVSGAFMPQPVNDKAAERLHGHQERLRDRGQAHRRHVPALRRSRDPRDQGPEDAAGPVDGRAG